MPRKLKLMMVPGVFLLMCLPAALQAQQRRDKQQLEYPDQWMRRQGGRMRQELPYLGDANSHTVVVPPLKSRIWQKKFIVYDDFRGEMLRIERKKDYVMVEVRTHDDKGHHGRIAVGGPRKLALKNLVLFFGQKKAYGSYYLYDEIRAFNDPDTDKFPVVVVRFFGADSGVVYLDPMGGGKPQAIVNLASAPPKN
jgi:hypothetical protein